MSEKVRQSDPGAVNLPSADGYHFGDDHPWNMKDQETMIRDLWSAAGVSYTAESGQGISEFSSTDLPI